MHPVRRDIRERHQHESAQMSTRMRQNGVRRRADQLADRDDVEIERPGARSRFPAPAPRRRSID